MGSLAIDRPGEKSEDGEKRGFRDLLVRLLGRGPTVSGVLEGMREERYGIRDRLARTTQSVSPPLGGFCEGVADEDDFFDEPMDVEEKMQPKSLKEIRNVVLAAIKSMSMPEAFSQRLEELIRSAENIITLTYNDATSSTIESLRHELGKVSRSFSQQCVEMGLDESLLNDAFGSMFAELDRVTEHRNRQIAAEAIRKKSMTEHFPGQALVGVVAAGEISTHKVDLMNSEIMAAWKIFKGEIDKHSDFLDGIIFMNALDIASNAIKALNSYVQLSERLVNAVVRGQEDPSLISEALTLAGMINRSLPNDHPELATLMKKELDRINESVAQALHAINAIKCEQTKGLLRSTDEKDIGRLQFELRPTGT